MLLTINCLFFLFNAKPLLALNDEYFIGSNNVIEEDLNTSK